MKNINLFRRRRCGFWHRRGKPLMLDRVIPSGTPDGRSVSDLKKARVIKAASLGFFVILTICALSVALPRSAQAGDSSLLVWGYVTDSVGTPVEGAWVTMTDLNTGKIRTATTDGTGGYSNAGDEFGLSDWFVGDTMRVVATFNSQDSTPTNVVLTSENTGTGLIQIDTEFPYEIPEFGSFLGVMVALLAAGAVGAVFLSTRRK